MSHKRHILLSITLVAGCEFGLGLDSTPKDPVESEVEEICAGQALCISSVDPAEGPTTGGTRVTIYGAGFGADAVVSFGAAALNTTVLGEGELVVTTPPAAVEAAVDVTVSSSAGSATAYDAFLYTNTPTTDDSGGNNTNNAGFVTGVVESSYLVVGCPACFSLTDYLNYEVGAVFHAPVRGTWLDDIPTQGTCAENAAGYPLSSSGLDVGEWVYFNSSGQSLALRRSSSSGTLSYSSGQLESTDYLRNAAYDLQVPDGGSGGAFELQGVVRTPSGFDSLEPIEIINDDPRAFSARIQASRAVFTWAPTDIADGMVIDIAVYNPNGSAMLGEVVCHTNDNGSFQVPSAYLSSYPANGLLAIQIYRLNIGGAIDPRDGSTVEGFASFGVLGTGTLSP